MPYPLSESPERRRSGRPRLLLTGGVVALVAILGVAGFLLGQANSSAPEDNAGAPANTVPTEPVITWLQVGLQPVPSSPQHGPAQVGSGLASGFSHDELGAVLAALNISARLTASDRAISDTTARQQCFGDIDRALASIRTQRSNAPPESTIPAEVLYRVTAGEPTGDLVAVSVALATPQSRDMGGYAELTRTLQWMDGDWKMQLPPTEPPQLIRSVDGYSSLGHPNG